MARRKTPRVINVTARFAEGDNLNLKMRVVKFGKVRQLVRLLDDDSVPAVVMMGALTDELTASIVTWDLVAEDGTPIEPSAEEIDDLEFTEVVAITEAWLAEMTGPSDDLGKDSTSGANFPGQPLTMEAL